MRKIAPFVGVLGMTLALGLSACSDDDDTSVTPTPTPTSSASPSAEPAEYDLTCPDPIGNVTVTVKDDSDDWSPAYVKDSDVILDPIAFGEITFTDEDTGEVEVVDQPQTKPDADTAGAVECTFTSEVTAEENPEGGAGTINGSVTVVKR